MDVLPFDWSLLLNYSLKEEKNGYQILHFNAQNRPPDEESLAFIEQHLSSATPLYSDADILRYASDAVSLPGFFLEMGVCTGRTINFIAALNPHKKVYGFDSFQGLPEDWIRPDMTLPKEIFAMKIPLMLPPVLPNVTLLPGWFSETLPLFKKEFLKGAPIAFLHIDCDLYASTKEVLGILRENIVEGTVIAFDEFYHFPGFEQHEFKALMEFLKENHLSAEFLYYNTFHEQVVAKILL